MPQPEHDLWLNVFGNLVFFGSLGTWLFLLTKRRRDGYFLAYEPRRPAPWGPGAALLAVILALMPLTGAFLPSPAQPGPPQLDPAEAALRLALSMIPVIIVAAIFVSAVAFFSRALPSDLGLPSSAAELGRDIGIGVLTCLAAVIPVYTILLVLRLLLRIDDISRHPLVEIVSGSGELGVLILATIAAVIVAPIVEELTFRLLLQGWLEKWDAECRVRRADIAAYPASGFADPESTTLDESSNPASPPRGLVPIFVSSLLFALAHFGYGPEPVPIFFLALFIGYVYHRTHRIVPCMVAHATFNMVSMFILWRTVLTSS